MVELTPLAFAVLIGLICLVGVIVVRSAPSPASWYLAEQQAEELLRATLTREEYRSLQTRRYLDLPSPSRPGRVYRVPRGRGRVRVIEHGVPTEILCVQPLEPIPDGDVVLMHKLLIEGDEERYLRTANHLSAER